MKPIFLTFLILTYRRPEKVHRLLKQFLDDRWQALGISNMEIVIADDHSEDDSWEHVKDTLMKLKMLGWSVHYIYRPKNLRGDVNSYQGYIHDAQGEYVWFLCDDDILNIDSAIIYIQEVKLRRPTIAICGFRQGISDEITNDLGSEVRVITDFNEAVFWLIKYPKTTAYMHKRNSIPDGDRLIQRWDKTLFSWIGFAMILLSTQGTKLLLFPKITAEADAEYLNLQYSYRVFKCLYEVVSDCYKLLNMSMDNLKSLYPNFQTSDETLLCLKGLSAHYSFRSYVKYSNKILLEEKIFLFKNFSQIMVNRSRLQEFFKLTCLFILSVFLKKRRPSSIHFR